MSVWQNAYLRMPDVGENLDALDALRDSDAFEVWVRATHEDGIVEVDLERHGYLDGCVTELAEILGDAVGVCGTITSTSDDNGYDVVEVDIDQGRLTYCQAAELFVPVDDPTIYGYQGERFGRPDHRRTARLGRGEPEDKRGFIRNLVAALVAADRERYGYLMDPDEGYLRPTLVSSKGGEVEYLLYGGHGIADSRGWAVTGSSLPSLARTVMAAVTDDWSQSMPAEQCIAHVNAIDMRERRKAVERERLHAEHGQETAKPVIGKAVEWDDLEREHYTGDVWKVHVMASAYPDEGDWEFVEHPRQAMFTSLGWAYEHATAFDGDDARKAAATFEEGGGHAALVAVELQAYRWENGHEVEPAAASWWRDYDAQGHVVDEESALTPAELRQVTAELVYGAHNDEAVSLAVQRIAQGSHSH